MYKRRSSQDKLLFILSADNFAQSFRRMRYLREYADWQKKQASEIIGKQKEIAGKQKELEKTRAEKNTLLGAREDESRKLQTEESSQKEEVQQLNRKQKQLQADLKKKKKPKLPANGRPVLKGTVWHVKRQLLQERKSLKQNRRRIRPAKNVSPIPKAVMP